MASIKRRAPSLMGFAFQKINVQYRSANWKNADLQGETSVHECVNSLMLGWPICKQAANVFMILKNINSEEYA